MGVEIECKDDGHILQHPGGYTIKLCGRFGFSEQSQIYSVPQFTLSLKDYPEIIILQICQFQTGTEFTHGTVKQLTANNIRSFKNIFSAKSYFWLKLNGIWTLRTS